MHVKMCGHMCNCVGYIGPLNVNKKSFTQNTFHKNGGQKGREREAGKSYIADKVRYGMSECFCHIVYCVVSHHKSVRAH